MQRAVEAGRDRLDEVRRRGAARRHRRLAQGLGRAARALGVGAARPQPPRRGDTRRRRSAGCGSSMLAGGAGRSSCSVHRSGKVAAEVLEGVMERLDQEEALLSALVHDGVGRRPTPRSSPRTAVGRLPAPAGRADRRRPDVRHRRVRGLRRRSATGTGWRCGCACAAGTSRAATPRRTGTPRRTSARPRHPVMRSVELGRGVALVLRATAPWGEPAHARDPDRRAGPAGSVTSTAACAGWHAPARAGRRTDERHDEPPCRRTGRGSCGPTPATRARRSPTRCTGATSPRARPGCRSPSTCRRRPATTPTTCSPAARSARSACRCRTSATCARSSTASRWPG